ncbi:MAG: hypothetical protein NC299_13685, partial [Lachnospiraceae bacterium]|nr:hypothetical protein [Lachnospiraceae bacterium]
MKKIFQTTHKKSSFVSLVYRGQDFSSFFGGIFVYGKFILQEEFNGRKKKVETYQQRGNYEHTNEKAAV